MHFIVTDEQTKLKTLKKRIDNLLVSHDEAYLLHIDTVLTNNLNTSLLNINSTKIFPTIKLSNYNELININKELFYYTNNQELQQYQKNIKGSRINDFIFVINFLTTDYMNLKDIHYKQKYIKYKQKYLKLKSSISKNIV
jgi:Pyruvate/2-oxoacid:ferredoxin oxidoreductase gamma subunit